MYFLLAESSFDQIKVPYLSAQKHLNLPQLVLDSLLQIFFSCHQHFLPQRLFEVQLEVTEFFLKSSFKSFQSITESYGMSHILYESHNS